MKVVINKCHGGFSLSHEATMRYAEIKGINLKFEIGDYFVEYYINEKSDDNYFSDIDIPRDDLALIQVVEELGKKADGRHASLKIVEIPNGAQWEISEYDGAEWVAEKHRTWS